MSLSFNVNPAEFAPGETVGLWARAMNPLINQSLNNIRVEFLQDGVGSPVGAGYTGSDGVVTASWTYPNSGIHTIVARVTEGQAIANCTLAVQTVTLTVGIQTKLLLWVERDPAGTYHVIYGKLVMNNGTAVAAQNVTLNVNGTAYILATNGTGHVSLPMNLQSVEEASTIYQVEATFNGTNPLTANLTAKTPYGQEYAVCTTMQYALRPSCNSTLLTVMPQSTEAVTTTKTPEQIQQETAITQTYLVFDSK